MRKTDQDLWVSTSQALQQACQYAAQTVMPDGHWCGELKSNCTITAEYVFLLQAIGHHRLKEHQALSQYFLSEQNADGSWSNAPGEPGNVSTSVEVYLALRILGQTPESKSMRVAQSWIRSSGGGVENVRVFTRINLATFGLFPWSAIPEIPAELIFLPPSSPLNIYNFASWARSTIIPLLIVCHHRPTFALPNGTSSDNDFLDELWCNPQDKNVPYYGSLFAMLVQGQFFALIFVIIDMVLSLLSGLRVYNPFRKVALKHCLAWIALRQESSGDWAGIFPPMHAGTLAYVVEGYSIDDGRLRRALDAIESFSWQDEQGKRIQACVSPVWDTILMCISLASIPEDPELLPWTHEFQDMRQIGVKWVKTRQVLENTGDWRVYRALLPPGGFSFEYFNTHYPDVDDTSAAIIAFLKDDPSSVTSDHVLDAMNWVLGMQCANGGWAAFDVDNDKLYLNRIPFSDMDSLCDPPTSDIVGRVLEAFGLFMMLATKAGLYHDTKLGPLLKRLHVACDRGIIFLCKMQTPIGACYGRWGANYIYGTSNVLCGLAYHYYPGDGVQQTDSSDQAERTSTASAMVPAMVNSAVRFLISIQNEDGGWGEPLKTYQYEAMPYTDWNEVKMSCSSPSTPSQTAWALLAISPYLPTAYPAVEAGILHLIMTQDSSDCKSTRRMPNPGEDGQISAVKSITGHDVGLSTKPAERGTSGVAMGRTWSTERFTGTGFPNHFYLGYTFYSHYFPMMALGEYMRLRLQEYRGVRCELDYVDTDI